jgi:RimJ/RimL family protein N-acetyltransferase
MNISGRKGLESADTGSKASRGRFRGRAAWMTRRIYEGESMIQSVAMSGWATHCRSVGGLWPLADLELSWHHWTLRMPAPDDLHNLIRQRAAEVARGKPPNASRIQEFALLQGYLRGITDWLPDKWHMTFCVYAQNEPVGLQGLLAGSRRTYVTTDSWIAGKKRCQGHATAARRMVLAFAFDHLGATAAVAQSWASNGPSTSVNRKVGYQLEAKDGIDRGDTELSWLMSREAWRPNAIGISIRGLSPECRILLGLDH